MKYGRFFGTALAVLVVSVLIYAPTWWFSGMGESEPSAVAEVLLWTGVVGFFGSILALIGGFVAYVVKGPAA